jgi:DNA-binding transcriptional MocR family regulator
MFSDFLQMLCMLLLEPGDGVLTEQYSYSHLVEHTLKLRGNHAVPVAMDALGVQPAALRAVLQASLCCELWRDLQRRLVGFVHSAGRAAAS